MIEMEVEEVLIDERGDKMEEEKGVVKVIAEGKNMGKAKTKKKTRVKKPNKYVEEWIEILPWPSIVVSTNDYIFKDLYFLCRDAICPKTDGFSLFMYFYHNRNLNVPICYPWKRNMEKLIFPEVFLDVDLPPNISTNKMGVSSTPLT